MPSSASARKKCSFCPNWLGSPLPPASSCVELVEGGQRLAIEPFAEIGAAQVVERLGAACRVAVRRGGDLVERRAGGDVIAVAQQRASGRQRVCAG